MKKKLISLLLTIAMCFSLCACGKSEAVKSVENQIANISATSENVVAEVELAYNTLTEQEKKAVENYNILVEYRNALNRQAADEVASYINWIGTPVNTNSNTDIQRARDAYDKLSETQRPLVENYEQLVQMEEQYKVLQIDTVDALIIKIGTVSLASGDAIATAQDAYDNLEPKLQASIENYDQLVVATKLLSTLKIEDSIQKINAIGVVGLGSKAAITAAETAYAILTEDEAKAVTNYDSLKEAVLKYEELTITPPVRLDRYRLGKNTIGSPEFYLTATNTTEELIKSFSITVFAYDADGVPVHVSFNNYYKILQYDSAVKAGTTTKSDTYWTLYGTYSEMQQIVVILKDVDFFDGSTWSNPEYDSQFSKYNEQLLAPSDINVLQH